MFCKNCGKPLGSGDKFCPECGTRVITEKPKAADLEPMFFVERREKPVEEKKPKKVVHLDEFQWDLDGFPTENRKTEAVDFDWASVLEDKVRQASPKPAELKVEPKEPKREIQDPLGEMPKTVEELLAALPEGVLEIVEEPAEEPEAAVEPEEVPAAEAEEPVAEEDAPVEEAVVEAAGEKEIEVKSLEQIIEDFGEGPMDEPTRLIDKSQMKADNADRFYVFSKKQAEYQNLLDQEYDRIQNSLQEKAAEEDAPALTVEEILGTVEKKPVEPAATEAAPVEDIPVAEVEEPVVEEPVVEEPVVEEPPVVESVPEPKPLELVAIAWSMPPAGILIETEAEPVKKTAGKDTLMQEAKVLMSELEKLMPEGRESDQEAEAEPAEEPEKEHLTFADIFNDEDDEEEEARKGGGCLKFIAVVLIILVIIELGILGIQNFAKDSEAAKFINQTYGKVVDLILGNDDAEPTTPVEEAPAEPSEIELLIKAQQGKNTNIAEIVESKELLFEADKDYGYEELADTYAFKNSPWYEGEDGKEVTYGDEIVGTLMQYYSALPDKINDVNKDVLDYVDNTTALYEELEKMEGDETRGYMINRLEIGEIRTGQKGFYAIVNVTSADKLQPEQTQQKQLGYLEANPNKNVIKIKETKNI